MPTTLQHRLHTHTHLTNTNHIKGDKTNTHLINADSTNAKHKNHSTASPRRPHCNETSFEYTPLDTDQVLLWSF